MGDLNANDIEAAMKIIEGTARSMGVTINEQVFEGNFERQRSCQWESQ